MASFNRELSMDIEKFVNEIKTLEAQAAAAEKRAATAEKKAEELEKVLKQIAKKGEEQQALRKAQNDAVASAISILSGVLPTQESPKKS